jgi:hypothetical protein
MIAQDAKLKTTTRSIAVCAVGMQAAYGDVSRAEAVHHLRQLYKMVQILNDGFLDGCWVRAAAKLNTEAFEVELKWFLASGRLDAHNHSLISAAIEVDAESNFASIVALEPPVDLFTNIFPTAMRYGEVGFLPNGEIPSLSNFLETELGPRKN